MPPRCSNASTATCGTRRGQNPVRVLQQSPNETLAALAEDDGFLAHLARVTAAFEAYLASPRR